MSSTSPYQYSGGKRPRNEQAPVSLLASPVLFTAAKPKPRMSLLPVVKARPTNPPRIATVAADAKAATGSDVVHVAMARPPLLQHLDEYLTLVGNVYYAHSEAGSNSAQFALIRRTTLGLLTSPVREPAVIDKWSPLEVAKFESALCLVGKLFHLVARAVGSKSTAECIEFFYVWKMGAHYPLWKASYTHTYGDGEEDDSSEDDERR